MKPVIILLSIFVWNTRLCIFHMVFPLLKTILQGWYYAYFIDEETDTWQN